MGYPLRLWVPWLFCDYFVAVEVLSVAVRSDGEKYQDNCPQDCLVLGMFL